MFGYSAEEAIGRSIRIIIPANRQTEEDDVLARLARGERIDHFETIRQRKDGTQLPVSLTVSPIRNADGKVVGASKIARDITERKQAEAALAHAEAMRADLQRRLQALVAASGELLVSPRVEHVLPAVLKLAAKMVTADAYAVWRFDRGANVWRVEFSEGVSDEFAKGSIPPVEHDRSPILVTGEPIVAEDIRTFPALAARRAALEREGIRSMLASPLRVHGETAGTLVFYFRAPHRFTEVETEIAGALTNLASAALATAGLYDAQRRSRQQADFLAEASAALASSLDYEGTLKRVASLAVPHFADWCAVDLVNETQTETKRLAIAHIDPAKVDLARRFNEQFPEDPESPYSVAHVVRSGAPAMLECLTDDMIVAGARNADHLRAVRELHITSFMIVPLSAHGLTFGALTFVAAESGRHYTVSELRLAENVASRAAIAIDNARAYDEVRRANQLKDDFLATLSHELRTPLNAILGYARMLRSGMLTDDREVRAFEIVERNATSLAQIVDDVLDVSRIISGKLRLNVQRVDLPKVITESVETVQPAADAKGVRIEVVIDPRAAPIAGDPDRLLQIMWNLLSNAVKFTARGGRVQVRLERIDSRVEIVVSDTGIGITPDFLPHIFERFRQADSRFAREHGGLGLGLAITRHLVEMHGGTITASSAGPGTGASFRVRVPIMIVHAEPIRQGQPAHTTVADAALDPSLVRLDGVHVLAVDDDDDALTLLREILESAGARVTTAVSGQQALSAMKTTTPDVLLTDIGMPGMDGFELIAHVRRSAAEPFGSVPAAALTAYARSEDRTRALRAGFQMHLAKPIDPGELLAAVHVLANR
jgi:PAS domain S-box-containing protein